ncbi:MAG: amidohydrolase family protein, partial [Adlercreutzia sp.]|nr:amidohydrolase family protein [Adlercreutzia sp.]
MLLCAQYILPVTSEPIVDGAVLVRDGVIRDIGKVDMLRLRYPDEEVIDQGLAAIMPGLVDLHTRLEQSVMRGVVNDAPYVEWLTEVARKATRIEAADWFDSAILGGLDALSSGITTVADITTTGASCTAVNKLGLRSVIYRQVGAMDKARIDAAMQAAQKDILHWREEVDSDRVTIGIAASPLFNNHPATLRAISEFATKEELPVALWLAGSREECDFVRYGSSPFQVHGGDVKRGYVEIPPWLPTGVSPVRYALNWNAFDAPNVMIVGAVCVDDEDVKKLREYDVAVCCCPRAAAQLGKGVAPLDEF